MVPKTSRSDEIEPGIAQRGKELLVVRQPGKREQRLASQCLRDVQAQLARDDRIGIAQREPPFAVEPRRCVDDEIEIAMELQVLEAIVEHEYIAIKVACI